MIANVPVRVMVTMSNVDDAPTTVVATVHPAATVAAVHSAAAVVAAVATSAHGAGRCRSKHGKAERSARGDGQKGRFTNS